MVCLCVVYMLVLLIFARSFCSWSHSILILYSLRCAGKFNYVENVALSSTQCCASAARTDGCLSSWASVEQCMCTTSLTWSKRAKTNDYTINNQSKMFVELLLCVCTTYTWIELSSAFIFASASASMSFHCLAKTLFNHWFHLPFPIWHLFDCKEEEEEA